MLDLALLPGEYAVCRMRHGSALPARLSADPGDDVVVSVSWTTEGISVICPADRVPVGVVVETAWRCLRATGSTDPALTGVLATLVTALAEARVNVVAFSTYDTDYLLVPTVRLGEAIAALSGAGHRVTG